MAPTHRSLNQILICFFAVFVLLQIQAQALEGGARQLSIIALADNPADIGDLFYMEGQKSFPVKFLGNNRSQPILVGSGVRSLVFARRFTDSKTGARALKPVVEGIWPDVKAKIALVILTVNSADKSLKAVVTPDDPDLFPVHAIRVVNTTALPLMVKLNEFSGQIAPSSSSPVVAYPKMDRVDSNSVVRYPLEVAYRRLASEPPVVLSSGDQEASPASRSVLIVLPPREQGSTRIRIKSLVDRPVSAVQRPKAQ
jgi:hypothetical protein